MIIPIMIVKMIANILNRKISFLETSFFEIMMRCLLLRSAKIVQVNGDYSYRNDSTGSSLDALEAG
jgi:hypothetical protein